MQAHVVTWTCVVYMLVAFVAGLAVSLIPLVVIEAKRHRLAQTVASNCASCLAAFNPTSLVQIRTHR